MKHIGLFAGIGGFELAAKWMNWQTVAWCEKDENCQIKLKKHFPKANPHADIRQTDFTIYRGKCDIITGGDPCQPHSVAGKRKGKDDERYLWPEYKRAISEILPGWVVNENVTGTISNGVLDTKIADLEEIGYTCWTPCIIPASATGAWHRRNRVWLIAHINAPGLQERQGIEGMDRETTEGYQGQIPSFQTWWNYTPKICGKLHGIPGRVDRIKQLGNAIVPQVAFELFKAIQQYHDHNTST